MQHSITRIASLVLAFGFFIGCSVLPFNNRPADTASLDYQQLQERLTTLNRQLSASPNNADLYHQKGNVLHELAQRTEEANRREDLYQQMNTALRRAKTLYEKENAAVGIDQVDELLKVSWSNEHNQGVEILQNDSTLVSRNFQHAATHFQNAITIIPDSVISYKMKAQAHYRNHNYREAIATLEEARRQIDPLPASVMEQLGFLYLESNQNEKAVELYEKAESISEQSLNLIHGLANAYIKAGQHQKAVELLTILVENEPDNIIYQQSRGIELYLLGASRIEELVSRYQAGQQPDENLEETADSLFSEAEIQLEEARRLNRESEEIQKALAQFYHNTASKYMKLQKTARQDSAEIGEKIRYYLRQSIPLTEQLAESNPDREEWWKQLYQAYAFLGMTDKADQVKEKANL
ncbi:MAG: tetratricopeptide repeat protein [Balneolaceae bacterium]|nr:tetratricopeptide repeat protein [Balneolaceae bacterium]